jgi:hypothetical protein
VEDCAGDVVDRTELKDVLAVRSHMAPKFKGPLMSVHPFSLRHMCISPKPRIKALNSVSYQRRSLRMYTAVSAVTS